MRRQRARARRVTRVRRASRRLHLHPLSRATDENTVVGPGDGSNVSAAAPRNADPRMIRPDPRSGRSHLAASGVNARFVHDPRAPVGPHGRRASPAQPPQLPAAAQWPDRRLQRDAGSATAPRRRLEPVPRTCSAATTRRRSAPRSRSSRESVRRTPATDLVAPTRPRRVERGRAPGSTSAVSRQVQRRAAQPKIARRAVREIRREKTRRDRAANDEIVPSC